MRAAQWRQKASRHNRRVIDNGHHVVAPVGRGRLGGLNLERPGLPGVRGLRSLDL